jgi:hypothetical protein
VSWIRWAIACVSILAFLLGGLWLLQGTGLVTIDPIACIGECEALEGPSVPWALAGAALMIAALAALWAATRRR